MEPSAAPEARLILVQPSSLPAKLSLAGPTITIGRAHDCTIPIRDRFLSRHHAEIVFSHGEWVVRDCGSANGTQLNGKKIDREIPLRPGDRISVGDSDIIFESETDSSTSQFIAVDSPSQATNLSIPLQTAFDEALSREPERVRVLNDLALELIEDRSMEQLFDFILERVMSLLHPSRAALALLGADKKDFLTVRVRRHDVADSGDLAISRTLLAEVLDEKRLISFFDTGLDQRLQRADSIIGQSIRSALCAPLIVGDEVLGVLYLDYRFDHGQISPEDIRLLARVTKFAAVKLENTRLRVEAVEKAKIDEELRTAYTIQKKLLPEGSPSIPSYAFCGRNRPCRTVSGDYFDYVVRPDGRIYFVVADVSGKGITAALIMSSLATAFNIFTRTDPSPGELLQAINSTLAPKTAPTRFATIFAGVLYPETGLIEFANGGHVPPLIIRPDGVDTLKSTDLVVGLFEAAKYRTQSVTLSRGESLVLFTDGITEAVNEDDEEMGMARVTTVLEKCSGCSAEQIVDALEGAVTDFVAGCAMADDSTLLALTREA